MYKCNHCGGDLRYDIASAVLKCSHCDNKLSVENYHSQYKAAKEEYSLFTCPNCGGEVLTNDSTITDFCSYCGSPVILERSETEQKMPKRIVPFKVTQKECEERYLNYIRKMPYAPPEYKDNDRVLDFRGIYVPFHVYDVEVSGEIQYKGEIDTLENARKKKHRVDIYQINSKISGKIGNIVHDASAIFSDRISEKLVQGNAASKVFHPAYLSGFFADVEDVSSEVYEEYVREKADSSLDSLVSEKLPGRYSLKQKKRKVSLDVKHTGDVLRPVWFFSRKTKDRVAYAVINGQTKDIEADIPINSKKLLLLSLITSAVLFLFLQAGMTFTPSAMMVATSFFVYLLNLVYFSNIEAIYQREIEDAKTGKLSGITGIVIKILLLFVLFMISCVFCIINDINLLQMMCSFFLVLGIIHAALYLKKWKAIAKNGTRPTLWIGADFVAAIILVVLSIIQPVHDYWYYFGGAFSLLITIITLFRTIADYNLICSRPLPQFKAYKGGFQHEEN